MSENEESELTIDAPEDKTRGVQEYVEAVEMIAEIAAVAIELIPGMEKVKFVGKLVKGVGEVAPKLKVVAAAHDKLAHTPVLEGAKERVPDVAKLALEKAGDAKAKAFDPVRDKMAEQAAAKARREARRSVIEAAEAVSIADFKKRCAAYESFSDGEGFGYLAQPGCYVFVLLAKGPGKDLAAYRQVYVGSAVNDMGSEIAAELMGDGNPDIYADAKYDQDLYVLLYPCAGDKVDALKSSLVVALDANASYNSREIDEAKFD